MLADFDDGISIILTEYKPFTNTVKAKGAEGVKERRDGSPHLTSPHDGNTDRERGNNLSPTSVNPYLLTLLPEQPGLIINGPTGMARGQLKLSLRKSTIGCYYDRMLKRVHGYAGFLSESLPPNIPGGGNTVVLLGFELAQPCRKPIDNIITWVQCFSQSTAAMAQHFPKCTLGFMSHMLTVLKVYNESRISRLEGV